MIPEAKFFKKPYEDAGYIDDINADIELLNRLISTYNSASVANKAEALMQVRQQLLHIDANIGSMQTVSAIAMDELQYNPFFAEYSGFINSELSSLGCPGLSDEQINQWELQNCKSDKGIPSAIVFEEKTKPSFFASIFGIQTSTHIKGAQQLLSEINPRTINDPTEDNYYQLVNLKQSIRELIASEPISKSDQVILNDLIARTNYMLSNIVENNPQLKSKVFPPKSATLAQDVANLSYEEARQVTNALLRPDNFNADTFHEKFDDVIPGLKNYNIKFLGGANAKNYLVENRETGEQVVLKITPLKGNPRKSYERLKSTSVRSGIAGIYASQNSIKADDSYVYSLEVTEFCNKGDVLSHGLKVQAKIDLIEKAIAGNIEDTDLIALSLLYEEFGLNDKDEVTIEDKQQVLAQLKETQILNSVNIYSQMTDILLKFEENNAFFPDAKPTNFLINEFNEVLIADTKTFVDTKDGIVSPKEINKNGLLQYTFGFRSPQFENGEDFSADKEHAYLMGISLYCYVTGTDITEVPKYAEQHPEFLDLNKAVFESEKGRQLKDLIEGLTQPDPEQRLSMNQAKDRLHAISHDIKVEASPFKSKSEAYFYALHNVMEMAKTSDNENIKETIGELKILIENHEQNPEVAAKLLTDLAEKLDDPNQKNSLNNIANAIQNSSYQQTLQEKYENPLARRFESEMQIALLKSPTDKMMNSVDHVSKALLNVMAQMDEQELGGMLESFASNLTSEKELTGFGSQPEEINIQKVKEILQNNDPAQLNQILYIQFLFAQRVMRNLPESIKPPNQNPPTGKLLEIIKDYNNGEYKDNPAAFFDNFDSDKLRFISDVRIYQSELFKADPTRGRQGGIQQVFSSQMGVMLEGQNQEGLDVDPSRWTPDSKYQKANLSAPFTRDLIENDAVYAAGPSGMTSLFLGMMENYGNFATVEEKQNYFAAVSAYMVSGGLHSLHEVLGPAQYALDLIPGYNVTPPDEHLVGNPPNFHQFYQQQMQLDPQFKERYDAGWDNMMKAYAKQMASFVHAPIEDVSNVKQRVYDAGKTDKKENVYAAIPEEKVENILKKDPSLNAINLDGRIMTSGMPLNRDNKERSIQQSLLKINTCSLRGEQEKMDKAIGALFKTVCKTRGNIFKSYSTSTRSAQNLIDSISKDDNLKSIFGIQSTDPKECKKEIETKMLAACNDENIPAPNFSLKQ